MISLQFRKVSNKTVHYFINNLILKHGTVRGTCVTKGGTIANFDRNSFFCGVSIHYNFFPLLMTNARCHFYMALHVLLVDSYGYITRDVGYCKERATLIETVID